MSRAKVEGVWTLVGQGPGNTPMIAGPELEDGEEITVIPADHQTCAVLRRAEASWRSAAAVATDDVPAPAAKMLVEMRAMLDRISRSPEAFGSSGVVGLTPDVLRRYLAENELDPQVYLAAIR